MDGTLGCEQQIWNSVMERRGRGRERKEEREGGGGTERDEYCVFFVIIVRFKQNNLISS